MGVKMWKWQEKTTKYLTYMENIKSSSAHTLRAYTRELKVLSQNLDEDDSESQVLSKLRGFLAQSTSLSLASRNRRSAALKSFFKWMFEKSLTTQDLSLSIPMPKVPQKIPHFISADEAISVLKSYEKDLDLAELKDRTLFCLLYGGGLRVSEACQLRWTDVDWKKSQVLTVRKGGDEQWVPVPELTLTALKKLKAQTEGPYVFGDAPLNTRTAYTWIKNRGRIAGLLKPLNPHALRHSYATHMLSSGADLRSLQELLGHKSLGTTQKYTHLSTTELARAIDRHHPLAKK